MEDLDILIRISPENYHAMLKLAEERGYEKAQAENARFRDALESISKNSCCHNCKEAGLVAREALSELRKGEE